MPAMSFHQRTTKRIIASPPQTVCSKLEVLRFINNDDELRNCMTYSLSFSSDACIQNETTSMMREQLNRSQGQLR
jgi:hypothetical protein